MYTCFDCKHLNKAKKIGYNHYWNYGCNRGDYAVGLIKKDSDLKQQGCTDWELSKSSEQISFM